MVTEAARFVVWLVHRKVKLRTDNEPSIVAVCNALQKALRGLGLDVIKDSRLLTLCVSMQEVFMCELEQACGAAEGQTVWDQSPHVWLGGVPFLLDSRPIHCLQWENSL